MNAGPKCTATAKHTGVRCGKWATRGMTVCRFHGGTRRALEISLRSGGSSKLFPKRVERRVKELLQDPRILEADAQVAQYIAWYERYLENHADDPNYSEIRSFLEGIVAVKERAHKMRFGERYTITVEGLMVLAAAFADVVNRRVGVCPHCRADLVELRGLIGADVAGLMNRGDQPKREVVEAVALLTPGSNGGEED